MGPLFSREPYREARRRGVKLLLHSTHLFKNLRQILEDGMLCPAGMLIARYGREQATRFLHDSRRYEQFAIGLDYLNCSLSFPNVELLYKRSKSDWKSEWVHFSVDLKLLNEHATRFCPISAASSCGAQITLGPDGFRSLFAATVDGANRNRLPRYVPTHSQAEVLLCGPVGFERVESILVGDASTQTEVFRLCDQYRRNLQVQVAPHLFIWPSWLVQPQNHSRQ